MKRVLKYLISIIKGVNYIHNIYNIKEAEKIGVIVGRDCRFIGTHKHTFSTEPYLIKIGNHVSMTSPQFITHDGGVWIFRDIYPNIDLFGEIYIGNNVFIGQNAIILPNTYVGDNSIIAAGAVLKGKHEANSVLAGVPAKKICSIDDYFSKNEKRFLHIRNWEYVKKREYLTKL
jgi:acetyltransferase-like isoleucine patch superfamily enzyme